METKLSKQQKEILNALNTEHKKGYKSIRIGRLSKNIARKFNKGQDDRIWNKSQAKLENPEISGLLDHLHKKQELLTKKHSASFSRSLTRLAERGLIEKQYRLPINKYDYDSRLKRHLKPHTYVSKNRASNISLTKKGLKFFEPRKKVVIPDSMKKRLASQ